VGVTSRVAGAPATAAERLRRSLFTETAWAVEGRSGPGAAARRAVRGGLRRAGLLPAARALWLRAVRVLEPEEERLGRLEHEGLRRLLALTLARDANCVDVGCHRGVVLEQIVALAPAGRHVAYEPIPHMADDLAREFPGVDVRCAALSSEAGAARFAHVVSRPAYSGLRLRDYPGAQSVETITVPVETLDRSLPEGYVPDLIKIDVEGAERQVLEGGLETLRRARPVVVFELERGSAEHYGTRPADLHVLLCERAGLRIFDLEGGGPYTLEQLERCAAERRHLNFVARP
jgi:FkbM family methyltransferase